MTETRKVQTFAIDESIRVEIDYTVRGNWVTTL